MPEASRKTMGIASRSITQNIPNLVFKKQTYKKQKFAVLYTGYQYRDLKEDDPLPRDLEHYKQEIIRHVEYDKKYPNEHRKPKDPIVTAWSGSGFGVGVMGEKEVKWLEELYEAFNNKNVVIAMINHRALNPFAGTSLSLMIKDRLPDYISDMMYEADSEYFDLQDYEKKTGVPKLKDKIRDLKDKEAKKLRKKNGGRWVDVSLYGHNHGYHIACSAKWIDYKDAENREKKKQEFHTKYDIFYWVNYSDDDSTHGWFSVEEIKEWLGGKETLASIREKNEEIWKKLKK